MSNLLTERLDALKKKILFWSIFIHSLLGTIVGVSVAILFKGLISIGSIVIVAFVSTFILGIPLHFIFWKIAKRKSHNILADHLDEFA